MRLPLRLVLRLFRLIWGGDVDRALWPVLVTSLAGSMSFSAGWSFMGIWAIKELGASASALGFAFLGGAVLGSLSGYLGGHLSDHFGRRPLILVGWAGSALYMLVFLTVGDNVALGLSVLACAGIFGALGGSVTQAMVADLVPPEQHERAYASVRIAQNLGVTMGPPIGGFYLLLGDWPLLFVGVAALAAVAWTLAYRFLPRRGDYAPDGPPERGSFGVIRRDGVFLVYLLSGVFAYLVYVAYETVLPISLVDTHGYSEAAWGFLLVLNPAMVTLFQMRLTRRIERFAAGPKLVVAMLLMGLPFLLLSVSAAVPVVLLVIFVFVVGEMVWVPTSQSVIASLAPADVRGAYMGAFGTGTSVGFALAPFLGLQVRDAGGDTAMWSFFAVCSLVAAATAWYACRRVQGRPVAGADRPAEPVVAG